LKLWPKILKRNGRRELVFLSYEEFQAIQERLEEATALLTLRPARGEDGPSLPGYPLEQVRLKLGLRPAKLRPRRPSKRAKGR